MRWFEIDAGWMLIRSLYAVGLASDIYVRNKRWKPAKSELGDIADPLDEVVDPVTTP